MATYNSPALILSTANLSFPYLEDWLNVTSKKKSHTGIFVHIYAEEVSRRCSVKKVFLEISQNSLENTCARVYFLIKLQGLQLY